ncbi:hypothetical protein DSECCO2_378190 [anaerobic digester metagenome]
MRHDERPAPLAGCRLRIARKPGREAGEEEADVGPRKVALASLRPGDPVHTDQSLPPVPGGVVVLSRDERVEEGALPLGVRAGDRKDLPPPDPKPRHGPAAPGKFHLDRVEFPRARKGDVHALLRPRYPVVAPEVGEPAGRARAVCDERDEPHPRESAPEFFLVDGEIPRRGKVTARHPAHDAVESIEERCKTFCDTPDRAWCRRAGVGESAPDDQVEAVAIDPVPGIRPPEVGPDGAP